jgi:hypothetical protein
MSCREPLRPIEITYLLGLPWLPTPSQHRFNFILDFRCYGALVKPLAAPAIFVSVPRKYQRVAGSNPASTALLIPFFPSEGSKR